MPVCKLGLSSLPSLAYRQWQQIGSARCRPAQWPVSGGGIKWIQNSSGFRKFDAAVLCVCVCARLFQVCAYVCMYVWMDVCMYAHTYMYVCWRVGLQDRKT